MGHRSDGGGPKAHQGVVLCAIMMGLLGAAAPQAQAQVGPPPLQAWVDHECEKVLQCVGAPLTGSCIAAGFFCVNVDCSSQLGCSYSYKWECIPKEDLYCLNDTREEIHSPDCAPKCVARAYNLCVCECKTLGVGTNETESYEQCFTKTSWPPT